MSVNSRVFQSQMHGGRGGLFAQGLKAHTGTLAHVPAHGNTVDLRPPPVLSGHQARDPRVHGLRRLHDKVPVGQELAECPGGVGGAEQPLTAARLVDLSDPNGTVDALPVEGSIDRGGELSDCVVGVAAGSHRAGDLSVPDDLEVALLEGWGGGARLLGLSDPLLPLDRGPLLPSGGGGRRGDGRKGLRFLPP